MRPDIELTLLDSLNKAACFFCAKCVMPGIEAETIHKRAEEAGKDTKLRESFDVATARAVANMNILAEYCIPLIKMKGYFAAMKGPSLPDELEYARKAISSLGCDVVKTVPFILPDEEQSERFDCRNAQTAHLHQENVSASQGGTITKKTVIFRAERGSKMSIIYRKAELSDIPKPEPAFGAAFRCDGDPQKMAGKYEKNRKKRG